MKFIALPGKFPHKWKHTFLFELSALLCLMANQWLKMKIEKSLQQTFIVSWVVIKTKDKNTIWEKSENRIFVLVRSITKSVLDGPE
jgi:hypothetical protein